MSGWPDVIRDFLQSIHPRQIADPTLARAAVLLPLIDSAGHEPLVLLTRRTEHVRHHKGQISFPGGARDGAESLETTALRETEEELGVGPGRIHLLGRFHDYLSTSKFRVTVVVGLLDSAERLNPSEIEVAEILTVPLRFFVESVPEIRKMRRATVEPEVYFYEWDGQVIWGFTARILKEFAEGLRSKGLPTGPKSGGF